MTRRPGRLVIDVEELVTWAYRDQCVDRLTVAGILALRLPSAAYVSPTALVASHVALGTEIDRSTAGANFAGKAEQMQAVADDYIDLHDAVLRLPRFYADLTGGADYVVWDQDTIRDARAYGFDVIPVGTVERPAYRIATLRHEGARPRGPVGYRNGVPVLTPAAQGAEARAANACPLYPVERVEHLPSRPLHLIEPAAELIACGRAGVRPDVAPLVVERMRPRYAGKRKLIGYDPVYETLPAVVALQRATYAAWHCALTLLAGALQGLERFRVVGPEAPAAPWERDACGEMEAAAVQA